MPVASMKPSVTDKSQITAPLIAHRSAPIKGRARVPGDKSISHRALLIGLLTVGFSGKDGGRLPALTDHCFVVPSYSIHRIQEVHVVLLHVLWDLVHVALGEDDVL